MKRKQAHAVTLKELQIKRAARNMNKFVFIITKVSRIMNVFKLTILQSQKLGEAKLITV